MPRTRCGLVRSLPALRSVGSRRLQVQKFGWSIIAGGTVRAPDSERSISQPVPESHRTGRGQAEVVMKSTIGDRPDHRDQQANRDVTADRRIDEESTRERSTDSRFDFRADQMIPIEWNPESLESGRDGLQSNHGLNLARRSEGGKKFRLVIRRLEQAAIGRGETAKRPFFGTQDPMSKSIDGVPIHRRFRETHLDRTRISPVDSFRI